MFSEALKFYLLDEDAEPPKPSFASKALYKHMNWQPGRASTVQQSFQTLVKKMTVINFKFVS